MNMMRYISTRGQAPVLGFEEATLTGLASDGGLYVPEAWPALGAAEIEALSGLSFAETAVRVLEPFVAGSMTPGELAGLCEKAWSRFDRPAVTPLLQLDQRHYLLELFHGPTLAFKDIALQFLGLLFERFLANGDQHLTIVGATSGDTGSAAIQAMADRAYVDIFMLHPKGRISDVQRRQMTTVLAPNVHNIAIEGDFDAAQALVKAMFNDASFSARFQLAAVNSINWARLAAQVVYYFYAAVRLGAPHREVAFSVPTGNFGDVYAGYVAKKMGLPIAQLIVATNVNDILHRALAQGDYSACAVTPTASPSMDIQVSSNFERLLFDLHQRDSAALSQVMQGFEAEGRMVLSNKVRALAAADFTSARIDQPTMTDAMRWAHGCGQIIDPHTAIGLAAARSSDLPENVPIITLATAHPAKFRDAVADALRVEPEIPAPIAALMGMEERSVTLPATFDAVTQYIGAHARPRPAAMAV
jgi:threonine synthase